MENFEHLTEISFETNSKKIMFDFIQRNTLYSTYSEEKQQTKSKPNILFSKVIKRRRKKNKTIILSYTNNKFCLDIYNKNHILTKQKQNIQNIQKYLKKNLSNIQVLEIESLMFEVI